MLTTEHLEKALEMLKEKQKTAPPSSLNWIRGAIDQTEMLLHVCKVNRDRFHIAWNTEEKETDE